MPSPPDSIDQPRHGGGIQPHPSIFTYTVVRTAASYSLLRTTPATSSNGNSGGHLFKAPVRFFNLTDRGRMGFQTSPLTHLSFVNLKDLIIILLFSLILYGEACRFPSCRKSSNAISSCEKPRPGREDAAFSVRVMTPGLGRGRCCLTRSSRELCACQAIEAHTVFGGLNGKLSVYLRGDAHHEMTAEPL